MAALFNMKNGGVGWHLTSHLIAIVALFVACFAITGYITFRDDSVPGTALKDQDQEFEDINADTLTLTGDLTVAGDLNAGVFKGLVTFINQFPAANSVAGNASIITKESLGAWAVHNNDLVSGSRAAVITGNLTDGINYMNDIFRTNRTAFIKELDLNVDNTAADFGTLVAGFNYVKAFNSAGANNRTHTLPAPVAGQILVLCFASNSALDTAATMSFECGAALDDNSGFIDTATNAVVTKGAATHSIVRYTAAANAEQFKGFIIFRPAGTSYQVISLNSQATNGTYQTVV